MTSITYRNGQITIGNRVLVARTCLKCGRFLGSKHFQKKQGSWMSTCYSCLGKKDRSLYYRSVKDRIARIQQNCQKISLNSANNSYKRWSLKELDKIVEYLEADVSYKEIAIKMNRSFYSISNVIHDYELRKNWPTREKWMITFTNQMEGTA